MLIVMMICAYRGAWRSTHAAAAFLLYRRLCSYRKKPLFNSLCSTLIAILIVCILLQSPECTMLLSIYLSMYLSNYLSISTPLAWSLWRERQVHVQVALEFK